MPAFSHHLFVCGNQRPPGNPRGCCNADGSDQLRTALAAEIKSRGLNPLVRANKAGCLEQCEHGPVVAIYPQGIFYGHVTAADASRIIEETIINGRILDDLRIADECLNNPSCPHIVAKQTASRGA
ncbi:MAG: ferredoxin [Planctomycetaceae bacterium]